MANKQVRLKKAEKGSVLYHYTKSNGINGIINRNCFWATKSDFLNDPNEFVYIRRIIDAICKEIIKNDLWRRMFLLDVLEETTFLTGGKNREYFVLSFSKCRDSITMWSEFGSKTGYNIGLRSEDIILRIAENSDIDYHGFVIYEPGQQKKLLRRILCEYIPEYLQMSFDEILEAGVRNHEDADYQKACRKFQKVAAVYAMFFKHESFAQEEEYRFVFKKPKDRRVHFREKDGFMIPFIEVPLSEENLPIEEIVVAPQNHIDLAKSGMEYMLRTKGYHVEVSLSDIKLRY